MSRIHLLGVGPAGLTDEQQRVLRRCGAVVVSRRFGGLVEGFAGLRIPIAPVAEALKAVRQQLANSDVAILASGDPLFFGIGRTLLTEFGPEQLVVMPAISAMQSLCARFKIAWDDAAFVSLHGRNPEQLLAQLLRHDKTVVFTDREHSPDQLARLLLDYFAGLDAVAEGSRYTILVGERLDMSGERLVQGSLSEIAGLAFGEPNVMLLVRQPRQEEFPGPGGLRQEDFSHSRGLITKDEVRAVTLHKLGLPRQGVMWDVGAGSGSIGVEAARLCPELAVHAVERRPEELANIRANIIRHQAHNVKLWAGEAPQVLELLPAPDRVFVGGSGGNLTAILGYAASRLAPGGRLVVNAVTAKTRQLAPPRLHELGLRVEICDLTVSRRLYPPATSEQTELNPITIMVGYK